MIFLLRAYRDFKSVSANKPPKELPAGVYSNPVIKPRFSLSFSESFLAQSGGPAVTLPPSFLGQLLLANSKDENNLDDSSTTLEELL